MELLIHPTAILFPAKFSFTALKLTNYSSSFSPNSYKFHLRPPVLLNLPYSSSSRFRISAHFGRPTNRQNHLRKKLTQHQQVSESWDFSKQPSVNDFDSKSDNCEVESFDLDANSQLINDVVEEKPEVLGETLIRNKLEGWVDQYRKDSEFWGIGTKPIFTIFQDSNGNVQRVAVNEDEILRRSGVDPVLYKDGVLKGLGQVNSKILSASTLARDLEKGKNVLPENSSVVKYVSPSSLDVGIIRNSPVSVQPTRIHFLGSDKYDSFRKISRFGAGALFIVFVFSAIKKVVTTKSNVKEEYSRVEKEMLRRKIKARMEKEKNIIGNVEIIQDSEQPEGLFIERPPLDKENLMQNIMKAKTVLQSPVHFDDKIEEIRNMARCARELEKTKALSDTSDEEDDIILENVKETSVTKNSDGSTGETEDSSSFTLSGDDSAENSAIKPYESNIGFHDHIGSSGYDSADNLSHVNSSNVVEIREQSGVAENSVKTRFKIIQSVKEAREYLANKHSKLHDTAPLQAMSEHFKQDLAQSVVETCQSENRFDQLNLKKSGTCVDVSENSSCSKSANFPYTKGKPETMEKSGEQVADFGTDSSLLALPKENESDIENNLRVKEGPHVDDSDSCSSPSACKDSKLAENETITEKQNFDGGDDLQMNGSKKWIEKNFHKLEPVVEKIGLGFRDNYTVAKEKTSQDTSSEIQMKQLLYDGNCKELEWMQDETLREIVFKVRDNELAGKDPFNSITDDEKLAFFDGLEKKVELENVKLQNLHQWLHSNIENLDYGTDGISVYDPPGKVIPRWKGPPVEKIHEFLKGGRTTTQHEAPSSDIVKQNVKDQGKKPLSSDSRIVIQGSDGSIKAGKKYGKEYWQHTKKWSQGFLESYNAETDPEIKSVMKDVGKDLDRWITDKEIKESGDLMDRLPEKGQKFIRKKLDKVRREMELFGPQAVVSKYREYSDEKEKDYLWWLDLPFVLCIEMYTEKEGEKKVGLYSLEMGADLELDPKQYHVIAFEDAGDCKNMCYILQAHLEMLGNGIAFVVALRPKDAFRDAKANGFGVTVIGKGELQQLNVDQTVEEVEELISEIGSKIYQEKIMSERSLDVSSMMKGVFGLNKPIRRKRRLNKPTTNS